MEPDIDTLLTASRPPVTPRSPDLEHELAVLAAGAESAATPSRPPLRLRAAMAGLVALGMVSLGTAASAAGIVPAPSWAPWYESPDVHGSLDVSSGAVCDVRYAAKAIDDSRRPVSPQDRAAAVAAAREFLRDVDLSTIDLDRAVARVPSTAVDPYAEPEDRESFAVLLVLQERLDAELARQGLPTTVSVSAAVWCDGGDR